MKDRDCNTGISFVRNCDSHSDSQLAKKLRNTDMFFFLVFFSFVSCIIILGKYLGNESLSTGKTSIHLFLDVQEGTDLIV